MTVVIDAGVAFAGLVGDDSPSRWAREVLAKDDLAAPELLSVEVSHLLRRAVHRGALPATLATQIMADVPLVIDSFLPHRPLLARMWDLRHNLTSYDAAYVALAEALDAPLATLDNRLVRAPGLRCRFLLP